MEPKTIRFIRRGQPVALSNVPPGRTLLELLRDDLGATGTKEGCGEGDCGACTVVLGELDPASGGRRLRYRAINSCIRLAHSIDGMALWTVEDLAGADGALHPAQEAMVRSHGSQCGFCTPGFVMSLFGMYQNHVARGQVVTRELAQEELSGNLCRCTGYRPILEAATKMGELPAAPLDEPALVGQLQRLAGEAADADDAAYLLPKTLAELLALRAAHPQAQLVAGCTDVGLWVTKMHRQLTAVIDVTQVAELREISLAGGHLVLGAAASLADAFDVLVAQWPELKTFTTRFAGLPVRNSGTLGGNVANGSPIGDSMPLLIALNASVVLASNRGERELRLEDFYTGYRQTVLAGDEVVAWIKVPTPHPSPLPPAGEGANAPAPSISGGANSPPPSISGGANAPAPSLSGGANPPPPSPSGGGVGWGLLRAYKISKRYDDDISAVCLVINLTVDRSLVTAVSIGAGGVAATPARARRTEAALRGQPWTEATAQHAATVLREEFQPISDMRASAAYRSQALGNLLRRFWLESQGARHINLETVIPDDMPDAVPAGSAA